eukprot:5689382-Pyramimonas_sp.AAC.2
MEAEPVDLPVTMRSGFKLWAPHQVRPPAPCSSPHPAPSNHCSVGCKRLLDQDRVQRSQAVRSHKDRQL